ncbi:hypothetical protein ACFYNM_40310 [Streptomyces spororaveus]|uniref:hypothetical protein n=1 Tax=Streptomyces spororaveus TaxID=284039 RepID=UPI0036B49CDC
MTYDLAVREGDRPPDDRRARRTFRDLYERYPDGEIEAAPSERTTAYVDALPERWSDITEGEEETSPWP